MSKLAKALTAAAGNAGESLYVEDVFSTYLYTGNSATQTITNGIDLSGEGGLVWIKRRNGTNYHSLFDSATSSNGRYYLISSLTNGLLDTGTSTAPFTSSGFSLNNGGFQWNNSAGDYASWTFRKAEKFFDVVTYTGNGVAGRTVAHNLGSVPHFMVVKRTDTTDQWYTYHQALGSSTFIPLNTADAASTWSPSNAIWYSTTPTSTNVTIGTDSGVNASGGTYVLYLFASDAGGFGDDGSESIIKCGSYTGNGSTDGPVIDCGFEPQWLLIKNTSNGGNWVLMDAMRGMPVGDEATVLLPNASGAESSYANLWGVDLQANGFKVNVSQIQINESGGTMVYIAIRRPMKTPESGTEVFAIDTLGSTGDGNQPGYRSLFPVDMGLKTSLSGNQRQISTRLLQGTELLTESTAAEASSASKQFDYMNGTDTSTATSSVNMMWMFKRATGFFDVVAYTGNATVRTVPHNLGVVPELMIVKKRNAVKNWYVYSAADSTKYLYLNGTNAFVTGSAEQIFGNDSTTVAPTSSVFSLGSQAAVNGSGDTFIAYLFATLAGVSKVGSYTGTGADLNVDCGFSAGARFILIKRTDSTGDWYVYDSVRGIVVGNDPYFLLNTTAAQVTNTDYIDPLSSGFTVTSSASSTVNVSSGTYIFLAIA